MVVRAPPPGFRGAEQAPLAPFDDPATRRSRWALGVRLLRSLGAVLRAAPGVCECGDTANLGGRLVDGSCATSCLLLSGTRAQPSASVSSGSGLGSSARTLDEYCSSHPSPGGQRRVRLMRLFGVASGHVLAKGRDVPTERFLGRGQHRPVAPGASRFPTGTWQSSRTATWSEP